MRALLLFATVITFAVLAALFVGRKLERAMLTHGVMTAEELEMCPRCFRLAPLNGVRLERAMLTHGVMTTEEEACPRCFRLAPLNGVAADGAPVCIPCLETEVDLPRVEAEAAGECQPLHCSSVGQR